MKLTTLGLLATSMLLMAPPAMAVHGEPYTAYGTALLGTDLYTVKLDWSGYWTQMFTIWIKDGAGNIVVYEQFPGRWQAAGPVLYATEVLLYHGWAQEAVGGSAHFDIKGVQWQQVAGGGPNRAVMLYVGNYYDYQLQLVVPWTIPVPF